MSRSFVLSSLLSPRQDNKILEEFKTQSTENSRRRSRKSRLPIAQAQIEPDQAALPVSSPEHLAPQQPTSEPDTPVDVKEEATTPVAKKILTQLSVKYPADFLKFKYAETEPLVRTAQPMQNPRQVSYNAQMNRAQQFIPAPSNQYNQYMQRPPYHYQQMAQQGMQQQPPNPISQKPKLMVYESRVSNLIDQQIQMKNTEKGQEYKFLNPVQQKQVTSVYQMQQNYPPHYQQQFQQNKQPEQPRSSVQPLPYFNKMALHGNWGIIPSNVPKVPLTFDRSDPSFIYLDKSDPNNKAQTFHNTVEWNKLPTEDPKYYTSLQIAKSSRLDENITHSDPALNLSLIEPNFTDFEHFHHPVFNARIYINRPFTIKFLPKSDDIGQSHHLKDLKSLSGKFGSLIMVEHKSEQLNFITNVGMCSRLLLYYHKETHDDDPRVYTEHLRILQPEQSSPFIANIPKRQLVPVIVSNLYTVPVAKHPPAQTDFILVKSMKKPVFYIRRLDETYCAGLLEPRAQVLRPGTKEQQNAKDEFIRAVIINIFRGTDQYPGRTRIQVSKMREAFFPETNDPKLRQMVKTFATFTREQGNGFWDRKPDIDLEAEFRKIDLTPEIVCKLQSMAVGHWKLRKSGVNLLIRARRVYQQIQRLKGEYTKRVAEMIELELMKTPWARTYNFRKADEGHAMTLKIGADGSQVMRAKNRREKSDTAKPPQQKVQRAGTSADLRSLNLAQLRTHLLGYGVPSEQIDSLDRWKQVKLLRDLANKDVDNGKDSEITRNYARGQRNDYAQALEDYKRTYQEMFLDNLASIQSNLEQFHDDQELDILGRKIIEDDEEEEDDITEEVKLDTSEDPPELVPYGIYTAPTVIDWDSLGFAGIPRRRVAKKISVSVAGEGLQLSVKWIRRPHEIEKLAQKPFDVYPDSESETSEDLEGHVLRNMRKQLNDKLRRTKQARKTKGERTMVQSYVPFDHRVRLCNDSNQLVFCLEPAAMMKIAECSQQFQRYIATHGRGSKRRKIVEEDEGSDNEVSTTRVRISRRGSPMVLLNDALLELLKKISTKEEYWVFKESVNKKLVPDYYTVISQPMCFDDVERMCKKQGYSTVDRFYRDIKLIESNCRTYNSGRYEDMVERGEKMFKEFVAELAQVRDSLDALENEIDPVLKN